MPPAVDDAADEVAGDVDDGGPAGIGGRASQTQPTLLAMITTDSSGSPMRWQ
jgi:hypothetical protein